MTNSTTKCINCIFTCKNCINDCKLFEPMVGRAELAELNYEIRRQNINLKRFSKANGLKYTYLIKMLKNKEPMSYKILYLLNMRLNEKYEWLDYVDNF